MTKISERLERVTETISSTCARIGRDPAEVKLVIVTKSADIGAIKEVIKFGYLDLGENRVGHLKKVSTQIADFLADKKAGSALPPKINWRTCLMTSGVLSCKALLTIFCSVAPSVAIRRSLRFLSSAEYFLSAFILS